MVEQNNIYYKGTVQDILVVKTAPAPEKPQPGQVSGTTTIRIAGADRLMLDETEFNLIGFDKLTDRASISFKLAWFMLRKKDPAKTAQEHMTDEQAYIDACKYFFERHYSASFLLTWRLDMLGKRSGYVTGYEPFVKNVLDYPALKRWLESPLSDWEVTALQFAPIDVRAEANKIKMKYQTMPNTPDAYPAPPKIVDGNKEEIA